MSWIQLGRTIGKMDKSQMDQAEGLIQKGITILDELGVKPWFSMGHLFLAELYTDAGQRLEALESLKKAESMFREMGMDYWLAKTRKVLAEL